jgi:uncharacterized SAM-binding protein YcdF (DUF218 family)
LQNGSSRRLPSLTQNDIASVEMNKETAQRWFRRILLTGGLLALVYVLSPLLLNAAARQLIREDVLPKADAIVALGGDALCMRERHAAELYHRGLGRKIIIAGLPFAWGGNTGDAKRRYLICRGVADADILVLPVATNTRQEANTLHQMMRQNQWHSMIVVTSPFHSRRALFTMERGAGELKFYSSPVPAEAPEWRPAMWWTRRRDVFTTVREFISWGNTLVGGWQ